MKTRFTLGAIVVSFAVFLASHADAQTGLYITNAVVLPNGCGRFDVVVPSNSVYTLLTSKDLKKWDVGMTLEGPTNRFVITSPIPMAEIGNIFLRVAVGRIPVYNFFLYFSDTAGTLVSGTSAVAFPQSIQHYSGILEVHNTTTNFPDGSQVLFTGPAGSGSTSVPASGPSIRSDSYSAYYQEEGIISPTVPPPGRWTINYAGTNLTFDLPDSQANSRFIVPQPAVVVSGGVLVSVNWVWRNPTSGQIVANIPSYVADVGVQVDGGTPYYRIYDSHQLPPDTTSHTFTSTITWDDVADLRVAFDDDLGNYYVVYYRK